MMMRPGTVGRLGRLGLVAAAVRGAFAPFSPASLFANGEQGLWYDVSDFSTLFQDAAGTIPVTAVEQPVGLILDKRSQFLGLGPELVTNGDFSNGTTGWSSLGATLSVVDGKLRVTTTGDGYAGWSFPTTIGVTYKLVVGSAKNISGGIRIRIGNSLGAYAQVNHISAGSNITYYFVASATTTWVNLGSSVASINDFDNISVRELPGNHAYQATTTARGVLRARYNQLTFAEDFSNAFWNGSQFITRTQNTLETLSPSGLYNAAKITGTNDTLTHRLLVATTIHGVGHRLVIHAKKAELKRIGLMLGTPFGGAWFDLDAGTSGPLTDQPAITSHSITAVANGFYRCEVIVPITTANGNGCQVSLLQDGATAYSASNFACDGQGVYVWGADLRPANLPANLPPYQRIAAATDYDTVGFPVYLDPDGTDDSYQTGNIDFTATDKMTVWAGMRKADDTARILCELSANWNNNTGSMLFITGDGVPSVADTYSSSSRGAGNLNYGAYTTAGAGADSAVITATHDIAGDLSRIRRNGSSTGAIDSTGDKGTGNFGNYPLYLFSRGGTSLRWKGQFYGLIIRGAATDTSLIEQTEQYLNSKMGGIY